MNPFKSKTARYTVEELTRERRQRTYRWLPWLIVDTMDGGIMGRFRSERDAGIAASELNRVNRVSR